MAALIGKEEVAESEGSNDKSSFSVLVWLLSHFKAKMHIICPLKKSSQTIGKLEKFSNKCFLGIPTVWVFTGQCTWVNFRSAMTVFHCYDPKPG